MPSYDKQLVYLSQFEFSRDLVRKTNLKLIEPAVIEKLYITNPRSKNYGSISQLTGVKMPKCDLLIYSFPCQDLSTGGNGLGMKKGQVHAPPYSGRSNVCSKNCKCSINSRVI
ncbi:MAG: DNA cytosine methyltransferase [Eubacteriales bacterium]